MGEEARRTTKMGEEDRMGWGRAIRDRRIPYRRRRTMGESHRLDLPSFIPARPAARPSRWPCPEGILLLLMLLHQ